MTKNIHLKNAALVFVLSLSLVGCDKLSFLSKYLPFIGHKEEAPSAVPAEAQAPSQPVDKSNTLAKVGKWTLTPDEFKTRLAGLKDLIGDYNIDDPQTKKEVLDEIINQELLVQEAQNTGVGSRKDITDAVEEFKRTLLAREMFTKITGDVEVTAQEAQDYYNQNKDLFTEPAEWHVREIVVPAQEDAKAILIELLQGADFAALAQTRSKSESAAKGGDLGFMKEPKFPQMAIALSTLEVGATSSVFKGPDGFYIVKLDEKKGGNAKKFEDVKSDIKDGLTIMKKQQKLVAFIEELKKKTPIDINNDLLK